MITSDVINDVNKAAGAVMNSAVAAVGTDATEVLSAHLASALSTLGDAQYWEETISPTTIRNELSASDPSNPNATSVLQRGMKWLLASISKGRDVSDFYPHVVKLVGATSLEVRKMVYMYLVQYADHDATTRELSLLSINAFQRGLSDQEQLIRALALRVLSSIRINDILQIQILAIQKCANDTSPYVRKCAANALAKLFPRCDEMQRDMLLQIMKEDFLDKDNSTMVLTSALVAFCEICPDRLELLHTSYRKICHLLTDMDEWGQVVIIDLLACYCRRFFKEPKALKQGVAELIDQERRVHRKLGIHCQRTTTDTVVNDAGTESSPQLYTEIKIDPSGGGGFQDNPGSISSNKGGFRDKTAIVRKITSKGFYSDEEDESTDEENSRLTISTASMMRQPPVTTIAGHTPTPQPPPASGNDANIDPDLKNLDPDHQLLLTSSMPLLKSRNAGVVLAVCSLQYYCGVSSIQARSAIGKALVRIHRGRREIQYVVLTSIRTLVRDCPSAFAPFLSDFFVKALDPPFTRIIKIDILVSLALEPSAIEAVLDELRTYIRHSDKTFATAAIRAVGRVIEIARIVYDRHGLSNGSAAKERQAACKVALDALYGLSVVTQVSENRTVVGEAVSVMQSILLSLGTSSTLSDGTTIVVEDPNQVRGFAMRRILLLLAGSLSNRQQALMVEDGGDSDDDDDREVSDLERLSVHLKAGAFSSALWIVGEWMADMPSFGASSWMQRPHDVSKLRQELVRLVDACFPQFNPIEKGQAIHFASKMWLSHVATTLPQTGAIVIELCEHILAMGRVDVNPDVKDRARFESSLLHTAFGMKHDTSALDERPRATTLTAEQCKTILLANKPYSSYLPINDETIIDTTSFRFGTLSSLVGHQARGASTSLPPWAKKNSPSALREPIEVAKEQLAQNFSDPTQMNAVKGVPGFYDDESSSEESSSDSSSSSSESGEESSSDDSDSDDSSSSSSEESDKVHKPSPAILPGATTMTQAPRNIQPMAQPMALQTPSLPHQLFPSSQQAVALPTEDSSESDDSDDEDDSSDESDIMPMTQATKSMQINNVIQPQAEGNLLGMTTPANGFSPSPYPQTTSSSSAMEDLKGLVMAPIKVNDSKAMSVDFERDSSAWIQLVRPELCGGLAMNARYLRGLTRTNELRMRNISHVDSKVVCIQLSFSNKKSDHTPIRRIKVLPRSSSTGVKTICPPEIPELKAKQSFNACLIFVFASMTNRDGDTIGRVEVKQGYGGSVPIEFKPSIGELLQPPKSALSAQEFDAKMKRMQGFQRVESSYATSLPLTSIHGTIIKHSSLHTIGDAQSFLSEKKLRLIGLLPTNDEVVLVKIESSTSTGGKIVVCCDNVVAINSILNLVKRAIKS